MLSQNQVSGRSAVIATYKAMALLQTLVRSRSKSEGLAGLRRNGAGRSAKLGVEAMIAGTIAAMLTATVAGILY